MDTRGRLQRDVETGNGPAQAAAQLWQGWRNEDMQLSGMVAEGNQKDYTRRLRCGIGTGNGNALPAAGNRVERVLLTLIFARIEDLGCFGVFTGFLAPFATASSYSLAER